MKDFFDMLICAVYPLTPFAVLSHKELQTLQCFGSIPLTWPSLYLLNLVVLSESDAWGAPLSEPESSLTRSFPTGSKFNRSMHIVQHILYSLEWLYISIDGSPHEPLHPLMRLTNRPHQTIVW